MKRKRISGPVDGADHDHLDDLLAPYIALGLPTNVLLHLVAEQYPLTSTKYKALSVGLEELFKADEVQQLLREAVQTSAFWKVRRT
jgi:hypothetical protein